MPTILKGLFVKTISTLLFITVLISLLPGCNKNAEITSLKIIGGDTIIVHSIDSTSISEDSSKSKGLPVLDTIKIISVTKTLASITGNIVSNGGSAITETGVCYATHANVSISDHLIQADNNADTLIINLSGLTTNSTYYVRAYAKNASGTGYSDEISFTTIGDTTDPYDLSGTWKGFYIESSTIDAVYMRMQMNVTIQGDEFKGIVTAVGLPDFPTRTLSGVVNSDGTQLTLIPDGITVFENPWTITGNKISGAIRTDPPIPPDSVVVRRSYEFTKQ